jgi:hypothetical protein
MAKRDKSTQIPSPKSSDFIREAVARFDEAEQVKQTLMRRAKEDFKFAMVPGHQWDKHLTSKRRNKPCYEFNRIRQMIRRVTGQQLQNRPQIKVRPAENGDVDTAEILNGLIRNIEATSDAKIAYDNAFTWACAGGVGAWEVTTDYEDDDRFDKCIRIEMIDDPERVTWDPEARDFFRRDARYCFVSSLMPKSIFEKLYPGKEIVDFGGATPRERWWWYKDSVRVAKYWYKETEKRVIYRLNDGSIVDAIEFDPIAPEAEAQGIMIEEVREIDQEIVKCCLISGKDRLTEPVEWPGKYIPVVMNWGELVTVDGEQHYFGMTRFGRDAQMVHNFELSTLIEVVAKMPNSPLTATPKMIEGLQSYYERLGYDDPPVLLYNVDPAAPQARPTREPPAAFPAALSNVSALAIDEIKATTGVYDASLGARSNESSGRAILARQQEADISNYVYIDNHLKALKYTGEILVDLIPKVYDATRTIRILGEDGAEKFVTVNKIVRDLETGEVRVINDLTRGKYDVVVSTGKSFETQRMEIAEVAEALSRIPGPVGMIGQYLLIKNLDAPDMDEMLKAVRRALVQAGLLEPNQDDPPPPQPPPPNPKDVADAELKSAQAQKALAQAAQIAATTPAQAAKSDAEAAESLARVMAGLPPPNQATGFAGLAPAPV